MSDDGVAWDYRVDVWTTHGKGGLLYSFVHNEQGWCAYVPESKKQREQRIGALSRMIHPSNPDRTLVSPETRPDLLRAALPQWAPRRGNLVDGEFLGDKRVALEGVEPRGNTLAVILDAVRDYCDNDENTKQWDRVLGWVSTTEIDIDKLKKVLSHPQLGPRITKLRTLPDDVQKQAEPTLFRQITCTLYD